MEVNYDIVLEEIYIPSKHNKDSYLCENFIIYPEGKEKNGGYILGIVELRATPVAESEKIVQTLVNNLKENYYNQITTSPEPQKLNLETVFEHALQKTNEALSEMIAIGHIKLALENLHYVLAVAYPNPDSKEIDFYFTQQGLIQAYLLHKTQQNNYKVISIIDNTPKLKDDNSHLKIFSSTLSGKIYYHDTIFLASEIFSNYIPAHKVNQVLSNNELRPALDYFKNLINNVKNNSHLTYCAIFIKMGERRANAEKPVAQKSIDNLLDIEKHTEKYLTPTFSFNFKIYFLSLLKKLKSSDGPRKSSQLKRSPHLKIGQEQISQSRLKNALATLSAGLKSLRLFRRESASKETASKVKSHAFHLTKYPKAIFIGLLILVIILVGSVFWIKHRQQVKQNQIAYSNQIKGIQDQLNTAQVNLIYQNESESLKAVKQAEDASLALNPTTPQQKAAQETLGEQIVTLKNKLLHIEKIVPQLVVDVSPNQPFTLSTIQLINNQLFFIGASPNLYIYDITKKNLIAPLASSAGDLTQLLPADNALFILTKENKILKYQEQTLTPQSLTWSGETPQALRIYNNTLYVLDAKQQQIFKFPPATNGFGAAQTWIKNKSGADLSRAVDFALDGNVYVLTSDTIYKFFAGNRKDFTPGLLDPALQQPKKIFTDYNLAYIYILDGGNKRIIVLDKNGGLKQQYSLDSLSENIADFFVNESAKTLWLISGSKVYQAGLK